MAEYGRRSWKTDEGDWVERRHRHNMGRSPERPAAGVQESLAAGGHEGFVRRTFQDHRPQPVTPAPPPAAPSPVHADDNVNLGGRWVTLLGVPRDACLEVREYMEAHYGPTKALYVAPPPSAAAAAMGQQPECFLCFESAVHATQAVHTGALHFFIEHGASVTVAAAQLANLFPDTDTEAAHGDPTHTNRTRQRPSRRDGWSSDGGGMGVSGAGRRGSEGRDEYAAAVDGGDAGRIWVDIAVQWCPDQRILSLFDRPTPASRKQEAAGRASGAHDLETSPSATDPAAAGGLAGTGAALPPDFIAAAAVSPLAERTSGSADDNSDDNNDQATREGDRTGSGERTNSSVLGLFFASATHGSVWMFLFRAVLLVLWTVANLLRWAFLGRRPTGVHLAAPRGTEHGGADTLSSSTPPSSSSSMSSSLPAPSAAPLPPTIDPSSLLQGQVASRSHSRRRRSRPANPVTSLWQSLASLSDGGAGEPSAPSGNAPYTSFSPARALSAAFYAVLRPVAPTQSEVDLVLWSWLRLRSPHVHRSYRALRTRLRRLARAFASGRDTAVGVYGNLDEPFYKYSFTPGTEAFGWDGAFSDFRLFDDDFYYHGSGGGGAAANRPERSHHHAGSGAARGGFASRQEDGEPWLSGPTPLRVLVRWRPAPWITRYSVLSAAALAAVVLYALLVAREQQMVYA